MFNLKKKFFIINRIKKQLIIGFSNRAGRNFFGRKTIFTQSGGVFNKLRIIDFKRSLHCNGILLSIEKDINRTSYIGLICYENGLYTYIILPLNYVNIGSYVYGFKNLFAMNYSTFLLNVPNGNFVHHIEIKPGYGAKLSRAAGASSFIISNEDLYIILKMNSGWLLKISKFCIAVIGIVSNNENYFKRIEKAGKNRNLGWRPKVRGVAMNPCDHPHGGGEGTGSPPRAHKTPWGKLTKIATKRTKKFLLKKKLFKKT